MATTTLNPAAPAYRSTLYEWLTTTDHKKIGIMYLINSMIFFMAGGLLALVVRVQLATPAAVPNTMGGLVTPEFYNQAFTMHASFMLFLFIIPILAGFGNYVVPLQIGAPDMAFPRINALSFWLLPLGGALMASGFFVSGGAAAAGWTEYPPLSGGQYSGTGTDLWIMGLVLIGTSSILGAINFLVTIFKMRAPGMTLFRMPILTWTVLDHERPRADGHAGPDQRADHAVHRPQLRRPLLRPGQRRQRDPVPERVLVLLAPGGLHHGPAGDGDHQRGAAGLLAQAAVRLQGVRVRDGRHRRPRLLRVGAPHVHDRRRVPAVLQPHDVPDRGADRASRCSTGSRPCGAGSSSSRRRSCSRSAS